MTFEAILQELKQKKFRPIYFLCGEEPYFIDAISDYIENHVLAEEERDFNQTILYGQDTDTANILANAKRFPMMSEKQVVIIKEAQNVKDLISKDEERAAFLLNYIQNPQPTTVLVFCYKNKTIDKRTALAKAIDKHAVLFVSEKVKDYKLAEWITAYIGEKGYRITPKASILVSEFLGADLSKIANEFDKLFINVPPGQVIDEALIEKYIGVSKEYNIFELNNALGKRDALKVYKIVDYFARNQKNYPLVMTIGTLYGYFTKLLLIHTLDDKTDKNVASVIGIHPFIAKDYIASARIYPYGKLRHIITFLREADMMSKGIGYPALSEKEILNELMYKILN